MLYLIPEVIYQDTTAIRNVAIGDHVDHGKLASCRRDVGHLRGLHLLMRGQVARFGTISEG